MTKMKNKKRVKAIHNFLRIFSNMSSKQFKEISPFINDKGIKIISECIYNSIYNPSLPEQNKLKLKKTFWKHKEKLRQLADFQENKKNKKVIVNQIGRGFPLIAKLIIPFLEQFLSSEN